MVKGQGLYGLVILLVMTFLMVSRFQQPDQAPRTAVRHDVFPYARWGELVPRTFEQVKTEYVKGGQGRYADRKVSVCFPWWRVTSDGQGDTGFGLSILLKSNAELAAEAAGLKRGEFVRVTGSIEAVNKGYFVIGKLEELTRITEEELFPCGRNFKSDQNSLEQRR